MHRPTITAPLAAAFIIAAGFWAAACACSVCARGPTNFQRIGLHTETIRLGGASVGVYITRGNEFYNIAAGEYSDVGLSSRKEAYGRAIADLSEAVRLSANNRDQELRKRIFQMRGDINLSAGNFTAAAADYSEAIRLNPGDTIGLMWKPKVLSDGLYFARGAAHYLTGAYDKAIYDFKAARRTRVADEDFLAETAIEFAKKRIAAGSKLPPAAEREYFRGLVYYNNYDAETERHGVKYFAAALKLDTANAEYHRMLGLALYRPANYLAIQYFEPYDASDRPSAMRHFAEAVRLAPNDAKHYAARAKADSLDDYRLSLRLSRDKADNQTRKGWIDNYTQAIRLAPDVPEYRIGRAAEYLRQKNYDKALADYLDAVKSDTGIIYRAKALAARDKNRASASTGYSDNKFNKMLCAELKRLYNNGADLCGRRFTLKEINYEDEKPAQSGPAPDTEKYHYNKAKNKHSPIWGAEAADSAIVHYTNLIKRFTKNAPYYARRAMAHYERAKVSQKNEKDDSAKAVADYAKAVEMDPSFLYWEWLENAWLYSGRGSIGPNVNFITALYSELLGKSPGNAEYYYQRGRTLAWHGGRDERDKAIADFNEALRLKPNVAVYHKALGDIYLRKGDCKKALENHLKAMRLDPDGIYLFLKPGGDPINGYRAMLDKAIEGGGNIPLKECKIITAPKKGEEDWD